MVGRQGEGDNGELLFNGYKVKRVLETDVSEGSTKNVNTGT